MENVAVAERTEVADVVVVEEDVFDQALCDDMGWCPSCGEFTTPGVGARASGRSCAECFDDRVSGGVHARNAGFISVAQ